MICDKCKVDTGDLIVAKKILRQVYQFLDPYLKAYTICTDYEGEIRKKGDTIHFRRTPMLGCIAQNLHYEQRVVNISVGVDIVGLSRVDKVIPTAQVIASYLQEQIATYVIKDFFACQLVLEDGKWSLLYITEGS